MASPERDRGNAWAAGLRAEGAWVTKIPASSVAGFPDWLVAVSGQVILVEAKTLEAVSGACWTPIRACSRAQSWVLHQIDSRAPGCAFVLVLAPEWARLLSPRQAARRWTRAGLARGATPLRWGRT